MKEQPAPESEYAGTNHPESGGTEEQSDEPSPAAGPERTNETPLEDIPSPQRLLVPVASAPAARAKLRNILPFAQSAYSTIIVLYVMTKHTPDEWEKGQAACKVFAEACMDANVPVQCEIRQGEIVEEILQIAREKAVDAILLGASEAGLLERLKKGNIPKRVVKEAEVPVMILAREIRED